jgi:hypothetical protein
MAALGRDTNKKIAPLLKEDGTVNYDYPSAVKSDSKEEINRKREEAAFELVRIAGIEKNGDYIIPGLSDTENKTIEQLASAAASRRVPEAIPDKNVFDNPAANDFEVDTKGEILPAELPATKETPSPTIDIMKLPAKERDNMINSVKTYFRNNKLSDEEKRKILINMGFKDDSVKVDTSLTPDLVPGQD